MNLQKEFKTLILPIIKGLPFLVALLVLVFIVVDRSVDYMTPEYQATATLKIDTRDDGVSDFILYQTESAPAPPTNGSFLTEVELFKSHGLKKSAFENLDFGVSYWRIGKVREQELFDERPFTIEYEMHNEDLWDKKFYLEFWGKDHFRLYKDVERTQFIKNFKFDKTYKDENSFTIAINPNLKLLEEKPSVLQPGDVFAFRFNSVEKLVKGVNSDNLYVKPIDKEIHIVKLYYNDPVPEKAALFVNALAEAYISTDQKKKAMKADKTLAFIDSEIKKIRKELSGAERALSRYRASSGLIDSKQETDAMLKQINSFNLQKVALDLKEVELNNLYEYIVNRKSLSDFSPDLETISDEVLKHTYLKLKDLELDKTSLLTKYPEGSTQIEAITAKITHLKEFTLETIKKKQLNINEKRTEIAKKIEGLYDEFKSFPDKERQLAMLQRDFTLKEQTYEYLTTKRTELGIVQSSKLTFHQVIDYADIPKEPISPNRKLFIGLALLLALLGGMGLIYLYTFFFDGVSSEDDIKAQFGIPIMATVKKVKKRATNPMEPFLNLYTNLNNINMLKGGKTIAVCSANAKEGKSIVTAQLGKLLASFDLNVLLIDMNMDNPTLHQHFQMENYAGMDDILERDAHAHSLVRTNGNTNISLITAGNKTEATSTKVFAPKTESFLRKMRSEYDVILIDTAAISKRLDAAAVMRVCDANLYLFRKGRSKKRRLENAQEFIKDYHIPNVYLVFNKG